MNFTGDIIEITHNNEGEKYEDIVEEFNLFIEDVFLCGCYDTFRFHDFITVCENHDWRFLNYKYDDNEDGDFRFYEQPIYIRKRKSLRVTLKSYICHTEHHMSLSQKLSNLGSLKNMCIEWIDDCDIDTTDAPTPLLVPNPRKKQIQKSQQFRSNKRKTE